MPSIRVSWLAFVVAWAIASAHSDVKAGEQQAAGLLPGTTLVYAQLAQPQRLLETVLGHALWHHIESLEDVQRAYEQKEFLQLKAVVSVLEAELGLPWRKIVAQAAAGGMAVAVEAETSGVALLVQADNESSIHDQLISHLVKLVRRDAEDEGRPDPIESGEHRGIVAQQIGDAIVTAFGPWLLVTNKADLGRQILDHYLDGADGTVLARQPQFTSARTARPPQGSAWMYVNLEGLRAAHVAEALFSGHVNNPLAELLVGGILSNLQKTPFATAALDVSSAGITLELAAPHQSDWIPAARDYFFGRQGDAAPPLLGASQSMLSISAYRDVSQMWLRADDLFSERVNDQIAEADSNLTTLFSGKDFGEEILGAVTPAVQLIAVRQRFAEGDPQPAIKLPSLALVFQLRDPETMRNEMRRTFQSLIGFLNVVGAMNGQPQLDLDMEKEDNLQLVTATYLPEKGDDLRRLKINFNFSPSVAFADSRFIVASTKQLARELATAPPRDAPNRAPANSLAAVDFQVVRRVLADNRGQLVAQNMLEEGHSKEEAEKEIGQLLELLGFLRDASAKLTTDNQQLRFGLELNLNDSPQK